MNCPKCGHNNPAGREYCLRCGQKTNFSLGDIASSVSDEAAVRRGEQLSDLLGWLVLLLVVLCAAVAGYNMLFDRTLSYDGAGTPTVELQGGVEVTVPTLERTSSDPRPSPMVYVKPMRVFAYRRDPIRSQLRSANGGDNTRARRTVKDAIQAGQILLGSIQNKDGSWPVAVHPADFPQWETANFASGKIGVTSLAILALLGDGDTWVTDDGARPVSYAQNAKRGIEWLKAQQNAETGHFGTVGEDKVNFFYNHAMATLAMAEAGGLTGDRALLDSAQLGVDLLVKTQLEGGGWNYFGRTYGSGTVYISVWAVQALAAAREAGLKVPDESLVRARNYFKSMTRPDGRVAFDEKDDGIFRASLNGAAAFSRLLLNEDPTSGDLRVCLQRLEGTLPKVQPEWGREWRPNMKGVDETERSFYNPLDMYLSTYAYFFAGGSLWEDWNMVAKDSILFMQDRDGAWRTNDQWSRLAGTAFSTATSVLTLQCYYRITSAVSVPAK